MGAALLMGVVLLAWWVSRPTGGAQERPVLTMPKDRGPVGSAYCGTSDVPKPPPPVDSPFGVHLFASTPLGVINPLRAMSISESLMPPESAAKKPVAKTTAPAADPDAEHPPLNETGLDDVQAVSMLLQEFRRAFGAMPVGELNDEIVRRLQGENPKGLAVLPKSHPALNQDGELMDRWGTPYRFHPESAWMMTVRSAGPDRKMWTVDDILSEMEGQPAADGPSHVGAE